MEYVKADFVPQGTDYHTAGKAYEFRREEGQSAGWANDDNDKWGSYILLDGCFHLEGGSWILCDKDGNPVKES